MNVKSVVRSYWDERSRTYGIDIYKSQSEAQRLWKTLLKNIIRTNKNLRIPDVGTGTGFLAMLLAEMGHNVTGIDISCVTAPKTSSLYTLDANLSDGSYITQIRRGWLDDTRNKRCRHNAPYRRIR